MYVLAVSLFMLVLPLASIAADVAMAGVTDGILAVIVRWFVFWGVGGRLFVAGVRQIVQPQFTAQTILGLEHEESLVLVRELGFANVALGTIGLASILIRPWVLAAALSGAIFYGLAGIGHLQRALPTAHERIAMVSDLGFAALLALLCGLAIL